MEDQPAPYPKTSSAETTSRDIFYYLMDRRYVQGEISVLDKHPNIDGTLELINRDGYPIGKIEVQLKTLDKRSTLAPKYSCPRSFISYCKHSELAVLLIVVDQENKVAYWLYVDDGTIEQYEKQIEGETHIVHIPSDNSIRYGDTQYIEAWIRIVSQRKEQIVRFKFLEFENKQIRSQLLELQKRMKSPVDLPLSVTREILVFVDELNYILDKEFPSVKQFRYPGYWKIGVGIVDYRIDRLHIVLYPVKYGELEIIKTIDREEYNKIDENMLELGILLIAHNSSSTIIREAPTKYAYELLDSSILETAGRENFFLDDLHLANEYLMSFIDRYSGYLGLEPNRSEYTLEDVEYTLRYTLPMLEGNSKGWADWVTESDVSIDSKDGDVINERHKRDLDESKQKVKDKEVAKVKVYIVSEKYNINLIYEYIGYLRTNGLLKTTRIYEKPQRDKRMVGVDRWKTWNILAVWANAQIFFRNFYRIYERYLSYHYPKIRHELSILPSQNTTLVFVLRTTNINGPCRPWLEVYSLLPIKPSTKSLTYFFRSEDINVPLNSNIFKSGDHTATIDGVLFVVKSWRVQTLDFLFADSPTYFFLNENLSERLKHFFACRTKDLR